MGKLDGKIAVITGATTGIGLAAAKLFAAEGAGLFISGRRQMQLNDAIEYVGSGVRGVLGDVGNLADLDRLFAVVKDEAGSIDVLFANAGGGAFARTWILDLADRKIRVNVLAPGNTSTPGWHRLTSSEQAHDEMLRAAEQSIPLGRLADPAEIASAALFLASDDSSFVTGIELFVDGASAQI